MPESAREGKSGTVLDFDKVKRAIKHLNSDAAAKSKFDEALRDLRSGLGENLNGAEFSYLVSHLLTYADEHDGYPEPVSGFQF